MSVADAWNVGNAAERASISPPPRLARTAQHDVAPAGELALDVDLRDRRPAAVLLDALSQILIVEAVVRPGSK